MSQVQVLPLCPECVWILSVGLSHLVQGLSQVQIVSWSKISQLVLIESPDRVAGS